jgi:hypothetical protein
LYLFLWLVLVCRVHRLGNAPSFMIPKVRKLLGGLSFGYTTMPQDAKDTYEDPSLSLRCGAYSGEKRYWHRLWAERTWSKAVELQHQRVCVEGGREGALAGRLG